MNTRTQILPMETSSNRHVLKINEVTGNTSSLGAGRWQMFSATLTSLNPRVCLVWIASGHRFCFMYMPWLCRSGRVRRWRTSRLPGRDRRRPLKATPWPVAPIGCFVPWRRRTAAASASSSSCLSASSGAFFYSHSWRWFDGAHQIDYVLLVLPSYKTLTRSKNTKLARMLDACLNFWLVDRSFS